MTYSVKGEWTPTLPTISGQETVAWKRRKERIAMRGDCPRNQPDLGYRRVEAETSVLADKCRSLQSR